MVINETGEVISIGKPLKNKCRYKHGLDAGIVYVTSRGPIDIMTRNGQFLYVYRDNKYHYWFDTIEGLIMHAEREGLL